MEKRILLIEDDFEISDLLSTLLKQQGFAVTQVFDGEQGEERALQENHDVIILDIMLPKKNGLDVLRDIRGRIKTPILMLTAKGDDIDRIIGFEVGADDYLPKPFNPRELVARINALLRRIDMDNQSSHTELELSVGELTINSRNRRVSYNGAPIELTGTEFMVLQSLAAKLDEIVSKENLTELALGRKLTLHDRAIDMHVSNLRKKLPRCEIKTIRGVGYMFQSVAGE